MPEPTLELADLATEDDRARLHEALLDHNRSYLGKPDHRGLALLLRHEGRLVGGLVGETGRGVLYIDLFWLAPEWRRRGHGSRLLASAEAEARRRGCRIAWLDTYEFQARPFYERHGYAVFGELDGLPTGYRRWFMKKRLASSAGEP